jgi:hypothetical protein
MKSFQWAVEARFVPALKKTFQTGEVGEGPDAIVDSLIEQRVAKPIEAPKPSHSRKPAADETPDN